MFQSIQIGYISKTLLLAVLALTITGCQKPQSSGNSEPSVYDRVIERGEIRASYVAYPPYSIKHPETGELSGIFIDTLNEIGKRLSLKINWVEEVGWGEIFQGLSSGRHDIFGAGVWRNAARGKVGDFSDPLFYNPIKAYGRANERRFRQLQDLNASNVRISMQDGAAESIIAKTDYPKAQAVSASLLNPWTDVLLNISSGKADVTFAEPSIINLFLKENPGALKDLFPDQVIRIFSNSYAFKLGEPEFKAMINAAIEEIRNDGTLEKIITKYEANKGEFVRLREPYSLSE